jgi:hypothetical protein
MADSSIFHHLMFAREHKSDSALQRFLDSMKIGYNEWHDGIGYDLNALKKMSPEELKQVEELILTRKDSDWRDVEALAALNTPSTIQALKDCLQSNNFDARLFATKYLKEMGIEDHVEEIVINTLPETKIGVGMTYALTLAETYPTERIRQTVLRCALVGNDDIRIHCAAMALHLYGKAHSNFDSKQKIIFEFRNPDLTTRMKSFRRLCSLVGVKPDDVLK